MAHPHRELDEARIAEPVAKLAERAEPPSRVLRLLDRGGHGHEAADVEVRALAGLGDELAQRVRGAAALRVLAGDIDLDQYADAPPRGRGAFVEFAGELDAVDAVHERGSPDELPGLVRLQVADEVPGVLGQREGVRLVDELLHVVLPEDARTGGVGLPDRREGLLLADGDQRHRRRVAPRALAGRGDARPHRQEVL